MNRRLGHAVLLAVCAVLVALPAEAQRRRGGTERGDGTQPDQQVPASQQEKNFPLGNTWSAVALNGKPIGDRRATLQVDANLRGTGFGGCNTFSAAAYPLRQQGFAVGPIAVTKRACDKGAADFEKTFLMALRGTNKWDLQDGRLVLKGQAGEIQFDRGI